MFTEVKLVLALIAAALAVFGNIPYLKDMFRKKVKPHLYSWLLWSIVSSVVFFGQLAKGAGVGAIPTGVSAFFTILIFLFSFKYGFPHITKKDTFLLIFALLGLVPWFITKDPTISVVIMVSIDLIAFIPTLAKTWIYPKTEDSLLYTTNAARHGLALFSLEAYNLATMLHSIVMIIVNVSMTAMILIRRKKK